MRHLALLLLCSCIPVGATAPPGGTAKAAALGLPVVPSEDGPLLVEIGIPDPGKAGSVRSRLGCKRLAVVKEGMPPEVTAHELGHLLGLRHHPDPENIMHERAPTIGRKPLTEKQKRRASLAALFLNHFCR